MQEFVYTASGKMYFQLEISKFRCFFLNCGEYFSHKIPTEYSRISMHSYKDDYKLDTWENCLESFCQCVHSISFALY